MTDFSNKPLNERQMEGGLMDSFAAFVASKWKDDFCHSYHITRHTSWRRWRELGRNLELENYDERWRCDSISQAADYYSWSGADAPAEYANLSLRLQTAVQNNDESAARDLCFDIFKWGGVWKGGNTGSVMWLNEQFEEVRLIARLREASELLADMNADLDRFDGSYLLMNSSLTKAYAALNPTKLIIYDGRVGAALGLLARDYLRSIDHHGDLPEDLKFPWGAAQGAQAAAKRNKRNPSDEDFRFPELFGYRRDKLHARMMRHTSYLLRQVAHLIAPSSPGELARLERAMFMIGYDVSRSA